MRSWLNARVFPTRAAGSWPYALAFLLFALAHAQPSSAQTTSDPAPAEIVVNGVRIPDGPYPVAVDTQAYPVQAIVSRQAADDARFFSVCVKPKDNDSLRELIDGPPHRDIRAAALARIIRGYLACYRTLDASASWQQSDGCIARTTSDPFRSICQADYDRGALIERVLHTYAPGLRFTSADLADPRVVARFHARESRFNRTRTKGEIIYAEVANCDVAVHPDFAMALLQSPVNSEREAQARTAMIGLSPECTGGAKKVLVDPAQYRTFVADAVYSWTVALRGVDTLIPPRPKIR